uniref:RRM domain-containing protein n=1 Tax=Meleagris gallopavo TaxID=9103 RepID=G1MQC8_MELGA
MCSARAAAVRQWNGRAPWVRPEGRAAPHSPTLQRSAQPGGRASGLGCLQLGSWTLCPGQHRPPHSLPQQWTSSINRANKVALLTWVRETGIDLVQVNGQRRYGGPPPGWVGSPPPPGSEVYIAKLPRDLYEDTLIPLFQSVGQLYEFRLMLTFSGLNRGFAYAKYSDQRSAGKAIAALNNWEVQEGRAILVCRSFEKCELSVNGLPATLRRGELGAMLLEVTEGLLGLTLHNSPGRKQGKVAVLTYGSHRAAAMAKKALVEGNVGLFKKAKVEWLKPELKEQLRARGKKPPPATCSAWGAPSGCCRPRSCAVRWADCRPCAGGCTWGAHASSPGACRQSPTAGSGTGARW